MKLWFVVGTAAELIKLYPLLEEASSRRIEWRVLLTGQSGPNFWKQANDFGISKNNIIEMMPGQQDLRTSRDALVWFLRAALYGTTTFRRLLMARNAPPMEKTDYFVVHGDTLSTLIGTLYGRRMRLKIIHVEAGMRSHSLWSPFPEEITRKIVSRLAHLHMAPDEGAAKNLADEGIRSGVVVTHGNTVGDTLQLVLQQAPAPTSPYVLANIHRFENLNSRERWKKIVDLLVEASKKHRVVLVLMPVTTELLERDAQARKRLVDAGIELKPRLPFKEFSLLLHGAQFVITDGGSNQEECHYLGKPCLILRNVTERSEGLGGSCVLAKFDPGIINQFMSDPMSYQRPSAFPTLRPTDVIFGELLR